MSRSRFPSRTARGKANARFDIKGTGRRSRRIAAVVIAAVLVLALSGCCSMSRRPIPGICATDAARTG